MNRNNLLHTMYNCKYYIVFSPKYRRKEIYRKLRADIGKNIKIFMKKKRNNNNIRRILYGPFIEIILQYSISEIMGYSKDKSSLMIF